MSSSMTSHSSGLHSFMLAYEAWHEGVSSWPQPSPCQWSGARAQLVINAPVLTGL